MDRKCIRYDRKKISCRGDIFFTIFKNMIVLKKYFVRNIIEGVKLIQSEIAICIIIEFHVLHLMIAEIDRRVENGYRKFSI